MKILFSILALVVLLACLSCNSKNEAAVESNSAVNDPGGNNQAPQNDAVKADQTRQNEIAAQNEKFKIPPDEFKTIDFRNHSYPYEFLTGTLNITLKNGEFYDYFKGGHDSADLSDVYYVDLTGDAKPEAIVLLWHVSCGVSCDGGSALFYIYSARQNKLKQIWQFETGSLAYGCGLKSLTIKDRKIMLELFGRCTDQMRGESPSMTKFHVKDITRLAFQTDGTKISQTSKEFIDAPESDAKNYSPLMSINQ